MIFLSINIRGLGGFLKVRKLRELLQKEAVDFLALQETILVDDAESIARLFLTRSEFGMCQVPAKGRSGGLLCVWRQSAFKATNAFGRTGFLFVRSSGMGAAPN